MGRRVVLTFGDDGRLLDVDQEACNEVPGGVDPEDPASSEDARGAVDLLPWVMDLAEFKFPAADWVVARFGRARIIQVCFHAIHMKLRGRIVKTPRHYAIKCLQDRREVPDQVATVLDELAAEQSSRGRWMAPYARKRADGCTVGVAVGALLEARSGDGRF